MSDVCFRDWAAVLDVAAKLVVVVGGVWAVFHFSRSQYSQSEVGRKDARIQVRKEDEIFEISEISGSRLRAACYGSQMRWEVGPKIFIFE